MCYFVLVCVNFVGFLGEMDEMGLNYVLIMLVCVGADPFGEEEIEGEEELRPEYTCPFCNEDFDMVGLCCHIDEDHAAEAKNGVCFVSIFKNFMWYFCAEFICLVYMYV